jgi:lipopolysaccharide export system protein LptA
MHLVRFLKIIHIFLTLIAVMATHSAIAQTKVKLEQADQGRRGEKNGERYDRLIGNVIFTQNKTTIYCDSAHFYKVQNSIEAYGHVKILEGDSVTITGARLEYDGNTKKAKLRNNVVFTKLATATLYTDNLDYARPTNQAYYFNGGKLVDSINVLTSTKGYYNVNSNLASFKKNVHVKNPDYTMLSDSLQYNSRTKMIYFKTKTTVINKDSSQFIYEGGEYNTQTKDSDIQQGVGESENYTIEGKKYDSDGIRKILKIRGDVVMTSKKENLKIYGQSADYYKELGITKVYNNAYVAKVTENSDTLFMAADTLISIDNKDPLKKRLLAYNHVKIFKSDLQGIADSLEYRASDSTIYFYKDPVLWAQGNQLTADSISMLLEHNTISKIYLVSKSFVISEDTLINFNQIKGRRMTASVVASKINKVYVEGNGETIYFALDDKDKSFMGMNKIICSSMTIRFKQGRVNNLSFYVKPDANFIPPVELKQEDKRLTGFDWREDEKPLKDDVTHRSKQIEIKKIDLQKASKIKQ